MEISSEYEASKATLESILVVLRERTIQKTKRSTQFLIRRELDGKDFMEIRVAYTSRGSHTRCPRQRTRLCSTKLFRHKHEQESGRTSSVGNDILGFDSGGRVVNKPDHGNLDWVRVCENATSDHCLWHDGPRSGLWDAHDRSQCRDCGNDEGHLGLALALSVPVFVVVTKIDMCPPNVLQDTLKLL
ncbi:Uncharacterized protein FKW44_024286, partial [Caligus rogercresseyi]